MLHVGNDAVLQESGLGSVSSRATLRCTTIRSSPGQSTSCLRPSPQRFPGPAAATRGTLPTAARWKSLKTTASATTQPIDLHRLHRNSSSKQPGIHTSTMSNILCQPHYTLPHHTLLYHALPSYARPYNALPYYALPYTILCHNMLCHTLLCHALQCHAVPYHAVIACSAMPYSVLECSLLECSVIPCSAIPCSATQCRTH